MVGFHKQINLSWYEVGKPAMTHKAEALLGFRLSNLKGGKNRLDDLHDSEENNKVDKNLLTKILMG